MHLVQRALTPLTLRPKPRKSHLIIWRYCYLLLVQVVNLGATIVANSTIYEMVSSCHSTTHRYLLFKLLVGLRGVLHPRHVAVFTANFIRPPTEGVAICIVRVWSPDTGKQVRKGLAPIKVNSHRDVAFSPRIGSKIRINGLESWFSR